ncbi:MAG: sulfatase-like hydrolase/transferase [Caldilineaceae bacterium]
MDAVAGAHPGRRGGEARIVSRHLTKAVTLTVETGGALGTLASCEVMTADGPTRTNTPLAQQQVTFVAQPLPRPGWRPPARGDSAPRHHPAALATIKARASWRRNRISSFSSPTNSGWTRWAATAIPSAARSMWTAWPRRALRPGVHAHGHLYAGALTHRRRAALRAQAAANFERNVGYITELPADTDSFAYHLRDAGYNVGTVGKWHIGAARGPDGVRLRRSPLSGLPAGAASRLPALPGRTRLRPHFAVRDEIRGVFPNGQPGNVIAGIYTGPVEAGFPYFLAERTIQALERYAAEDASLACQWPGPHLPYYIPGAQYADMYDPDTIPLCRRPWPPRPLPASPRCSVTTPRTGPSTASRPRPQWRKLIAMYWGYVTLIDEQVGRILDADALGLAGHVTATFFTSDHGK